MQPLYDAVEHVSEDVLAQAFDVNVRTLANWRSLNFGPPYVRAGNAILYPIAGVREWLSQNVVTPVPTGTLAAPTPARRRGRPRTSAARAA